ncbi:MAG: PAS domain S-box protein [Gemmataceae bacterium]
MLPRSLALAVLITASLPAVADEPGASKLVVVLYPQNNDGSPGNALVDQSIRSTLAGATSERIEVYAEYLDVAQPADAADRLVQLESLRRKYSGRKVDLIIAGLSSALDFALEHRAKIFPGAPVVMCAVDRREVNARKLPSDVVGAPIDMDLVRTLELALRLHPKTKRVFVVAGQAKMDDWWVAEARREFRSYEDQLAFTYLVGLPMSDLLRQVANLPENSIVYYIHVFQDGTGRASVPAYVLEHLARTANAPIYGHVDSYMGRGVVGGRMFRFETAGTEAARIGLRILAGEKAEAIGIRDTCKNSTMLDWRQLQRWGIGEASLPPGSIVRFKEASLWDLYKWPIVGVVSLCVVETLLISALVVQRTNRRWADQRFRQVVEAAPNGMVMVGRDGTIVLANAQMERLFGYRKEEMLGQPVEMLLPERYRVQHVALRERFVAVAEVRTMGVGRDLFGRCKDGREFPLEIGLSPIPTGERTAVLASIVDVTERRLAEANMRDSQRELRDLTGRLIVAQECERRRIARELHDDLNQSLALLAVELDVMGQRPAESVAQFAEQVRDVSAHVKQLSSAVHDLSHQLHPSKLEQLGLVAAVRSLCRELTRSYGLPIEFSDHGVPRSIPEDTALCLYRIVQEALRNTVKHSHAHHAEVALEGSAETITLRIVDDGVGFAPESIDRQEGLGLVSMRERLRIVGGEIVIDSRPAGGTRIKVHVPLGPEVVARRALDRFPNGSDKAKMGVAIVGRSP